MLLILSGLFGQWLYPLMRMFSPSSNSLNEDNAASNREELLIPANLAPAEEAAVSKVSPPPVRLEGLCVTLPMPSGNHSRPQTLLRACHNAVDATGCFLEQRPVSCTAFEAHF